MSQAEDSSYQNVQVLFFYPQTPEQNNPQSQIQIVPSFGSTYKYNKSNDKKRNYNTSTAINSSQNYIKEINQISQYLCLQKKKEQNSQNFILFGNQQKSIPPIMRAQQNNSNTPPNNFNGQQEVIYDDRNTAINIFKAFSRYFINLPENCRLKKQLKKKCQHEGGSIKELLKLFENLLQYNYLSLTYMRDYLQNKQKDVMKTILNQCYTYYMHHINESQIRKSTKIKKYKQQYHKYSREVLSNLNETFKKASF